MRDGKLSMAKLGLLATSSSTTANNAATSRSRRYGGLAKFSDEDDDENVNKNTFLTKREDINDST